MDHSVSTPSLLSEPRKGSFEDGDIKLEPGTASPHLVVSETSKITSKLPSDLIPSTEQPSMAPSATKKKGTAAIKKTPKKRVPNGDMKKKIKRPKSDKIANGQMGEDMDEGEGEADESDNGPYCICRGPDDHRWMICCERCEDWFHGACINMDKEIGENLIEKFICPNCSHGQVVTIYKKTCAHGNCHKAAQLTGNPSSVFCSHEHAQMWWEKMVGRLPKAKSKSGLSDQLVQDEFMALLHGGLTEMDDDGVWKVTRIPFEGELPQASTPKGSQPSL